jgi:carbonic anhydrase/acetyltransferase-like protein (isoleucine patch superfamily)
LATVLPFKGKTPRVAASAFLAPTAVLVGDVTVGPEASVWFGAVLRGDHGEFGIEIGPRSNIQDNCVIHVGDWRPTVVGAGVTVGHGAKFESCTIEDGCVIGMNAVILPESSIGEGSLVAANSVVLEGTRIPPGSLVAGVPAKVRGSLEGSAAAQVRRGGEYYVTRARAYKDQGIENEGACEICGGLLLERHCKVLCLNCGFQRDCSDP